MLFEISMPGCQRFWLHAQCVFDDVVQRRIHHAKIANGSMALNAIVRSQVEVLTEILPSPSKHLICVGVSSSLWSRSRGRFDISFNMAWAFAREFNLAIATDRAPSKFRKSAMQKRQSMQLQLKEKDARNFVDSSWDFVIFDDVFTTGRTVQKIIKRAPVGARFLVSVYALGQRLLKS